MCKNRKNLQEIQVGLLLLYRNQEYNCAIRRIPFCAIVSDCPEDAEGSKLKYITGELTPIG